MIARRSFITGLISLVAAPAIVRVGSIMPVRVMEPEFDPAAMARRLLEHAERLVNPPWLPGGTPYGFGDLIQYGDGYLKVVRTQIMDDLR